MADNRSSTNNSCTDSSMPEDVNQDELIMAQEKRIEKEVAETTPLVGPKQELSILQREYATDDGIYQQKVKDLRSKYQAIRRTRGDGNCFFRAFAFAYFENLIHEKRDYPRYVITTIPSFIGELDAKENEWTVEEPVVPVGFPSGHPTGKLQKQKQGKIEFKEFAAGSKDELVKLGFPQLTIEDFHDTFVEVVEKVGEPVTVDQLLDIFNDQSYSDYLVVYMRLITSGQLQRESEFYANFVEGDRTVKEFCHQEVEPMYKESDHIHIIALTSILGIGVRIQYMDRGDGGKVNAHDFPEGIEPTVHLLYRPGHYDILYE